MLGEFAIICENTNLVLQAKKSSKVWRFIVYLLTHRHKSVPQEELIEVFFAQDSVGNPESALRTMVYRARSALAEGGLPFAEEMILVKSGGYSWNSTVSCVVDAEEFEALCKKANAETSDEKRLDILLEAAEVYQGDFLPSASGEMWVMPLARWYRSMYISCTHDALELLTRNDRNVDAEKLCAKTLRMDPFDEKTLEYHLLALLSQGKNAEALDEYKRMEDMYYDVLGVNFSNNLRALYSQIQRPIIKEGISLETVLNEWLETANFPGAFYCDLSVFKTMVQIESRSVSRSGRTAYIVRFDTKHEPGAKGSEIMKQLGTAISNCLRTGDLFTRAGPGQFMIMLYSLTYEDCRTVIDRIMHTLDAKYLSKIAGHSVKPVVPII